MIPCAPAHDTRDNLLDTGQHGDLAIFSNMEFRLFLFWLSGLLIRLVSGWLWLNHEPSLGGYWRIVSRFRTLLPDPEASAEPHCRSRKSGRM